MQLYDKDLLSVQEVRELVEKASLHSRNWQQKARQRWTES